MDKRKKENLRVKSSITKALFSLMAEKSLADIHITELVEKAGVARASFYRNYASKEDVLVTLIRDVLDEFQNEIDLKEGTFYTYGNILKSFQYLKKYREYVLDLYYSGVLVVLLEELNHFHENIEGNMLHTSIEKYGLYMYIGALLNTAITWFMNDEIITEEEIARYFFQVVQKVHGGESKK